MAEAAAAFYAVETVVEGAALGAVAISKATVPLQIRFHKIKSPDPSLGRSSHSLSIIRNRAYIFGGDLQDGQPDSAMRCITLPTDLALEDLDIDYHSIDSEAAPTRPLASYSDEPDAGVADSQTNEIPAPRAAHAGTVIGSNIYIFGGRTPKTSSSETPIDILHENGTVHAFSTLTNKWTTLHPHQTRCSQGVPPARANASLASSPHPLASTSVSTGPSTDSEHNSGTLFLHSGYSSSTSQTSLRDVWTFDISSRVWFRWADVPPPSPEETASEGKLICFESRLWRVGDGFGSMYYFDIVRDQADDAWGNADTELGVSPKTGEWEKLLFQAEQLPAVEESKQSVNGGEEAHPTAKAELLPVPRRSGGFLPTTTGAGREYLLYFLGSDAPGSMAQDIWSFQIASEAKSLAKAKDKLREVVGKGSGENQWARCDVIEATKQDGELERPTGMEGFAADVWADFGAGKVVLWGGKGANGGVKNEGWVLSVD